VPTVSLVGYTSAGKSTLFNHLTEERRYTSANLFATLDPLLRRVSYSDGVSFFLSDTVGFIKKLPVELVTSFRATLEEVRETDCICQVIDVTSPYSQSHLEAVESILKDIGAGEVPVLKVLNKIDLLPEAERELILRRNEDAGSRTIALSAKTGLGVPNLLGKLRSILFRDHRLYYLQIPKDRPEVSDSLARLSLILKKRENSRCLEFKVMADPAAIVGFLPYLDQGDPW
jgi:GTP-binding protein HflX